MVSCSMKSPAEISRLKDAKYCMSIYPVGEGIEELVSFIGYNLLGWSQYGYRGGINIKTQKRVTQLRILVLNFLRLDEGEYLSFSRDTRSYSAGRYNSKSLMTKTIISVMDELISAGLIIQYLGFKNVEKSKRYVTKVKPTDVFNKILSGVITPEMVLSAGAETIILRSESDNSSYWEDGELHRRHEAGEWLEYKDTAYTNGCRKVVSTYNRFMLSQSILVNGQRPKGLIQLYRVFNNGTFSEGGRFYGAFWVNQPKEDRKTITINGEPVTGLDFSSCHLSLVYANAGIKAPEGDLYDIPSVDRKTAKQINMYALAGKKMSSCISMVAREKNIDEAIVKQGFQEFLEKHAAVSDKFFIRHNMTLMRQESDITNEVLKKAVELGIPVLPVHDGYITTASNREELRTLMREAYAAISQSDEPILITDEF